MEKSLLDNLFAIIRHYRWRYMRGVFLLLLSNLLLILNPLLMRQALYSLKVGSEQDPHWLITALFGQLKNLLPFWVILLLLVAFLGAIFKYKMRVAFISISRDVEVDVRGRLFSRLQQQSSAFYDRYEVGELLSRLTNDVTAYRDILGSGILYPLLFLTMVGPGLVILFLLSHELTVVSFLPIIIIPLLNASFRALIYRFSKSVQTLLGKLSSLVQAHFSSIRLIRSYLAETKMGDKFQQVSNDLNRENFYLLVLQGLLTPLFALVTKLVSATLIFILGFIMLYSWEAMDSADFVAYMWIQSYLFLPILMFSNVLPIYERGKAAYERLLEIYEAPIEVKNRGIPDLRIPSKVSIEVKNLSFTYPTANYPALHNVTFSIKECSFVGITGPVGAGKTTLFKLIDREYEVEKGRIFLGGRDIHEYPLEAFSEAIVLVEQVPFLFSRTIAENVRFGRPEASIEEVHAVSIQADLHETVLEFPESYETLVGERGMTLSGGQKQRVAMARAFLVDRSLVLLDDVFSAVDVETEQRIFESMRKNFVGKTVLLTTQRATILNQMDHILYFQEGSLIESGTPSDLLALGGHYAALCGLQGGQK